VLELIEANLRVLPERHGHPHTQSSRAVP
jgi:hypothetical protein